MAGRVCKTLTLAERVEVLKRLETRESQSSVALEFGVNQSQISRIQKNKEKIIEQWQNNINPERKRRRGGKSEDVEEALLRWFSQARCRQIPVSGPLLMEKADQLASGLGVADFKATSGWLERWKARNAIQFKRQHGKRQDADGFGAEIWIADVLPGILKYYSPKDISTADESSDEPDKGGESEFYVPACATAEDLNRDVAVDDDLSTEGEISESSIVSTQLQTAHQEEEEEERSDDDDITTGPVSFATVALSLHIIRKFMAQKGCQSYEPLYELESVIRRLHRHATVQTSVSNFSPPS